MKKLFSILLLLSAMLSCSVTQAQGSVYETGTTFYEGDYAVSVAYAGGILYALRDSGLYILSAKGSEEKVAPAEDFAGKALTLLSDGRAVYGRDSLSLALLVDETGQYINRVLLTAEDDDTRLSGRMAIEDGTIYTLSPSGSDAVINSCSLDTFEWSSMNLPGLTDFDLMEDGRIIGLKQEIRWPELMTTLVSIDPATGESLPWAEVDPSRRYDRLIYRRDTDMALLISDAEILSVSQGGPLNRLDGFIRGDLMAAAPLDEGLALIVDGILVIRNFADDQTRRLSVLDQYGRGEDYRSFIENNPMVDLQFISSLNISPNERFAQDMITRNGDIDVYILSDINLLRQIKEKAYYVDMAGNTDIKALVDDMYKPFRSVFTKEQTIVAFPKQSFIEVLCYHKESFESLGLTPPATYEEYMDFCLLWLSDYAEDHPELTLNPFANRLSDETLFERYADEKARNGEALRFNTEDMARLIGKYLELRNAWESSGDDGRGAIPMFYGYDIPLRGKDDAYVYLPLSFDKGSQALIGPAKNEFYYFVINPYGQNSGDALAFAAASESQRLEVQKALLYQKIDEPMESAYFKAERAWQEQALQTLESMADKAEPIARRDIEAQIEQHKIMMEDFEATSRWAFTQSALDTYKGLADLVYINEFNPVVNLFADTPDLFDSVEALSIPRFLETLDSKINLILLENDMRNN